MEISSFEFPHLVLLVLCNESFSEVIAASGADSNANIFGFKAAAAATSKTIKPIAHWQHPLPAQFAASGSFRLFLRSSSHPPTESSVYLYVCRLRIFIRSVICSPFFSSGCWWVMILEFWFGSAPLKWKSGWSIVAKSWTGWRQASKEVNVHNLGKSSREINKLYVYCASVVVSWLENGGG